MAIHSNLDTTLIVPEAPVIAGLRFRRFQGAEDYPRMVPVINAFRTAYGIDHITTLEELVSNYSHLHNSDPYEDMIMAEVDGALVGYGRAEWWQEQTGERVYGVFGVLAPEWSRRGIGRAMLRYNERRVRAVAASHVFDGPRFLQSEAPDGNTGADALLRSEGYAPIRYAFNMVRPLNEPIPDAPLPSGLEVRPALPEHYRAVWEADAEAFRDHWGFREQTEDDYRGFLDWPHLSPELWQIGWDGDQVAGMVLNFVNRPENEHFGRARGYTEGISVRRPWRRRGLAYALLVRSLHMFKAMGMTEAALGVDAENLTGALRLYERAGFRVVQRVTTFRKPLSDDGAA